MHAENEDGPDTGIPTIRDGLMKFSCMRVIFVTPCDWPVTSYRPSMAWPRHVN